MITIEKLNIYRKYGGLEDRLARVGHTSEKQLFDNYDWGTITYIEQSIELIAKGLTSNEFKNKAFLGLRKNLEDKAYAEITKPISGIISEMKQQLFQIFLDCLLAATENITYKYFLLPVAYDKEHVHRERNYCYELYSQIRQMLPRDFPYTLSGEVNKAGHPFVAPHCGDIIPDFLVHNPGFMGPDDNLAIIEVKTIQGANYSQEGKDLLKDMQTLRCMTNLSNGYFKGIILIFGADNDNKKNEIENKYREICNTEKVLLIFHDNALTKARIV